MSYAVQVNIACVVPGIDCNRANAWPSVERVQLPRRESNTWYHRREQLPWQNLAAKERLRLTENDTLVSLVFNTDGVQVQDNPSQSAWPIFATIAEITAQRRFFADKILNLALWSGEGKPPVGAILRLAQEQLDDLNQSRFDHFCPCKCTVLF